MWKVTEKQHTPILTGLRSLDADREWEVEVVPLVVGRLMKRSGWKPLRFSGLRKKTGRGSQTRSHTAQRA
jgi:hypothetical protein